MSTQPSPKQQEARRLRAIEAIQQGMTQTHVAAMLGITSASISNWALRFRSGGIEELLAKPRGRPAGGQLTPKQADDVQRTMSRRCPDEAGLEARLWTWRSVQALIFRSCKTEISRWTALRYLNAWGFKPPKPMSRLQARATPAARQEMAARCRAVRIAARQSGEVFYCLERTRLAPKDGAAGSKPVSILWALGARAEAAFMAVADHELAQGMREFLDRIVDHAGGRTCVVVIDEALRRDSSMRDWFDGASEKVVVKTLQDSEI